MEKAVDKYQYLLLLLSGFPVSTVATIITISPQYTWVLYGFNQPHVKNT